MAVIRIRVLEALASVIGRCVPELEGHICAGPAEGTHKLEWPHLVITAASWAFKPNQDGDVWQDLGPSRAVFNVGHHSCLLQLRLGASSANKRAALEHAVSQVFISQPMRPGVLVVTLPDIHCAVVAYEFDSTEWHDENAFDKAWYSIAVVEAQVPALVERGGVYTLEEIRSSFTEDVTTDPGSDISADALFTVGIDENGLITAS